MEASHALHRSGLLWLIAVVTIASMILPQPNKANARFFRGEVELPLVEPPAVGHDRTVSGDYRYLVYGTQQIFIGMGYNPIYRDLPDDQRAANYDRDFLMLCQAGVNHITGWDSDKGYEQDKFDEITLNYAAKYGIGVIMPFYLPVDGNYEDEAFRQSLKEEAAVKIERFANQPALRMWGVGNEVLVEMEVAEQRDAFVRFYLELADLFHSLDPNHPVIYREAEDIFIPFIIEYLQDSGDLRPWLLFGTNVYSDRLDQILSTWPSYGLDRPLLVSEFGAEPYAEGGRAQGYLDMWRTIRAHADQVIGGAPYTWTTDGPEPTDRKWGLVDGDSQPVDDTFQMLSNEWNSEAPRACP